MAGPKNSLRSPNKTTPTPHLQNSQAARTFGTLPRSSVPAFKEDIIETQNVTSLRDATKAALDQIRSHRFVVDAHCGGLNRGQVERWLMCAGRESRIFPDILDTMIKNVSNPLILRVLHENLDDEYGNGDLEQAHFRHYLKLLEQIGINEAEFDLYQERAGVRLALELARNVSLRPDIEVAIGYMLVNEGMTPITYGAVELAAMTHFPDLSTSFFQLHVEVDEHHVEQLYTAAAELPDEAIDGLLFGVALGERGMAALLDEALGVYEFDSVTAGT